jgi:putative ABC transport system permease protein
MTLQDSFILAWRTVKSNKLRTGITVAIIAFGIMALIGIITAISAMNQSLKENFSFMGANAFSIRYKEMNARIMGGGRNKQEFSKQKIGQKEKKSNLDKPIKLEESVYFKDNYGFNRAQVSVYRRGNGNNELRYKNYKTNPQVSMWGGDENYLGVNGYQLDLGRNLNNVDLQSGRNVCLIGSNVATKLFPNNPEKSIDKVILVGGKPYRVIGLLKSKGSSAMMRQDDVIVTSLKNIRQYQNISSSYQIGVMVNNVAELDPAIGESMEQMRKARRLIPSESDNFIIDKSDKFADIFIGLLAGISGAAGAIGLITLIGAAIGLMNIMLVAVNERTREVGLIKALGGKRRDVRRQFLFESILISILGAIFGIILGVLVGNIFSIVLKTGFIVPWLWVGIGIAICTLVGLVAGIYPAMKAAALNPIDALRYE